MLLINLRPVRFLIKIKYIINIITIIPSSKQIDHTELLYWLQASRNILKSRFYSNKKIKQNILVMHNVIRCTVDKSHAIIPYVYSFFHTTHRWGATTLNSKNAPITYPIKYKDRYIPLSCSYQINIVTDSIRTLDNFSFLAPSLDRYFPSSSIFPFGVDSD